MTRIRDSFNRGRNRLRDDLSNMESQISDIQRTKRALQLNQIDTKAIGSDLGKTDRFFSASGRIDIPRVKAEIRESSQTSNNKIIDSLEFRANRSG